MKYSEGDTSRILPILSKEKEEEEYRSPWRKDFSRLIHCASFRRLQGKTQLFPGQESDFFRSRLTHSLEVAQIAKSIAIKLNHDLKEKGENYYIEPDLVEFAGLAHDLGHPPFGHFGEKILDKLMIDCGGFEGNAQTLRLITRIEKKYPIKDTVFDIDSSGNDRRIGLNLTARSIASILKYNHEIDINRSDDSPQDVVKGYYYSAREIVKYVKGQVCGKNNYNGPFKTIECQIMDIADDIAYSTYDLEDSFKAGFLRPLDMLCANKELRERMAEKVSNTENKVTAEEVYDQISDIFHDFHDPFKFRKKKESDDDPDELCRLAISMAHNISNNLAHDGYFRTALTSSLVGTFIRAVHIDQINSEIPALSTVTIGQERKVQVEILKHFVYESQILSPKIQIIAYRSKEIIKKLFDTISNRQENGFQLLPKNFRQIYDSCQNTNGWHRTVCDFIAGMTDRYAIEFYARLTSEKPETIFKPL